MKRIREENLWHVAVNTDESVITRNVHGDSLLGLSLLERTKFMNLIQVHLEERVIGRRRELGLIFLKLFPFPRLVLHSFLVHQDEQE